MKKLSDHINESFAKSSINEEKEVTLTFTNVQQAGGSKSDIESDYNLKVIKFERKGKTILRGKKSDIDDFVDDYGLADDSDNDLVIESITNEAKIDYQKLRQDVDDILANGKTSYAVRTKLGPIISRHKDFEGAINFVETYVKDKDDLEKIKKLLQDNNKK